jgi:hypothetical protein
MKNFILNIPMFLAFGCLFFLNSIIVFYHICVLMQYIPYTLIYGGKIQSLEEMYIHEVFSLLVNILILSIIYVKKKFIIENKKNSLLNLMVYGLCVIFMFVSIYNLIAINLVEILIAVPYTFISVVMCWRINLPDDGSLLFNSELSK